MVNVAVVRCISVPKCFGIISTCVCVRHSDFLFFLFAFSSLSFSLFFAILIYLPIFHRALIESLHFSRNSFQVCGLHFFSILFAIFFHSFRNTFCLADELNKSFQHLWFIFFSAMAFFFIFFDLMVNEALHLYTNICIFIRE